jgi:hypothetical protein
MKKTARKYELMKLWPENAARIRLLRRVDQKTGRSEEINVMIKRLLDAFEDEKK